MGFLRNMSGWEWIIILLIVVVVFGWKKLPDAARSLGRSMRILKSEVGQMSDDKDSRSAASSDTVPGDVADDETNESSGTHDPNPPQSSDDAATDPSRPTTRPTSSERDDQPHRHP